MINRSYISFFLLLAACLLLTLLYLPHFDIPNDDKEVFRYGGWVIFRGGAPYLDFFDHKPPLIFFFNFLGLLAGNWGLWLIDLALALLATSLFFRCCEKYKLPCPWLLPLLFNLMLRDFLISRGIGMTREFTTLFQLIFVCVILGKYRYRDYLAGLLTAAVFFMQQDQVLFLLPFLIYTVWSSAPAAMIIRILRIGAGFLALLLPILLFFVAHHALNYLWEDAFQFNFSWYTAERKSLGDHFRTIKDALDAGNYELPFMIAVTLGIAALFLRHRKKGLLQAALAGVILSMSAELLGGRAPDADFSYYFVPLSVSVVALLFIIFAFTEDDILRNGKAPLIYGFLLCCSLSYTAIQHATHLTPRTETALLQSPVLNYLRQHRPADYQLYVMGNTGYIYAYNEFKILSPSRWIYHQFWKWYDHWDPDQAILTSIGDDLLRHRTRYVWVDWSAVSRFRNPANYTLWMTFLKAHYQPVPIANDTMLSSLWEWKNN